MKQETQKWVTIAESDLRAAKVMQDSGFFAHSIFQCHEALEKLLKAMWIERHSTGTHPHIHDLPGLADQAGVALSEEQRTFLARLAEQYIPTRYGDLEREFPKEIADTYLARSTEAFAWLQQQLS